MSMANWSWLGYWRLLLRGVRALESCAQSLKRLADSVDPPPPPPFAPDPDPLRVAQPHDHDWVTIDRLRRELTQQLGREPDPDELVRRLDEEEEDIPDPNPMVKSRG